MKKQHAFPTENTSPEYAGMTLRDWFAGQALAGICAREEEDICGSQQYLAENAYEIADAMMRARDAAEGGAA